MNSNFVSSVTALSIKKQKTKRTYDKTEIKTNKQWIDEREVIIMQRDGKAHNHFMAIVLLHLAFPPKILIKVCTKCLLYAWDKKNNNKCHESFFSKPFI